MNYSFERGLLQTELTLCEPGELRQGLRAFAGREDRYRMQFLQSSYGVAFDGYSWPGQTDSLNQGPGDQLHSFVFSDFFPPERYPRELQGFLRSHWGAVSARVGELERTILADLGLEATADQFRKSFGHMMSANYYPAGAGERRGPDELRLTEHPDVSLMTVFPFGLSPDFQYQGEGGEWQDAPLSDTMVVFPGHLLEWMSDGTIPALNHRVRHSEGSVGERFSFALFSLPRPATRLISESGNRISVEDFYREHLSLWDD